ncbi:hypothetical protein FHS72_003313 [Loktanella ponticola]|uniref:Tyr recombinase domain-containing protein n=1 Tax=Yoonia ponticola TaxID=1524255 RepID=A0A7W9EZA4_9RHOB|nr:hypothetical protein [Yoonia ponticola]MBB5723668.1 hypothetical protein [Yoonia ponticola]
MTRRKSVAGYLQSAPAAVRLGMTAEGVTLAPGAAAVTGRFFQVVAAAREPASAPSAKSFQLAAHSEPTFRLLLRTLAEFAPMVSTAAALPVKREWVARRPKAAQRSAARVTPIAEDVVSGWPVSWQVYYRRLAAAKIAPSSLTRYRASIDRCAKLVQAGVAEERLGFLTACNLADHLKNDRKHGGGEIRPITIANYLEALIVLGTRGGADADGLAGMRLMCDDLRGQASRGEKLKIARISQLMERGGFAYLAKKVSEALERADALPDHSFEKVSALQSAVLAAVSMNKPGRTGDVSRWEIGKDLIRDPEGYWQLAWRQGKTHHVTEAGQLWEEVADILDRHILGGRPDRFVHMRYNQLCGANWLTLDATSRSSKWPSEQILKMIGVPLHDLRTLSADYLRRHDPYTAAQAITAHLGHRSGESAKDYKAVADGDVATTDWLRMREQIGRQTTTKSG